MVDYEYRDLFHTGSVEKHLYIQYDGENLGNEDLTNDSMELTECLCEGEELRFGSCCSSLFKITALNYGTCLVGQEISVWMEIAGAGQPFPLGRYTVYTDQESTDGQYRNIVAYDALCRVLKTNMADWYNSQTFPMTMREFRDLFFAYFNIKQETITLINDAMLIEKTIDPSEISGKDVLTSICEINGCFGRMNRHGTFQYIILEENMEGLYPADDLYPAVDLFPRDTNFTELEEGEYFTCLYEKLISHRVTKLQIRQEEHDVGITVGEGDNGYVVEDNFLVYGKGTEELTAIADNLLSVVGKASYQPYTLEAIGDPCLEPGDCIRISVDGGWIESYVLKRVLKGIQMLDDTYSAPGKEYHSDNAGGMAKKIKQLKGKMNKIEHTVEMTRLEITDLEKGLTSRITQTADAITAEAKRAQGQEVELAAAISIQADQISSEVTRAQLAEQSLSSRITQTADAITAEVKRAQGQEVERAAAVSIQADQISSEVTRAQQAEQGLSGSLDSVNTILSSRITQTADQITAEVKRAQGQEVELAAAISIQANQISLKVAKGEVSSQLSVESDKIHIESDRFSWTSTYSALSSTGKLTARDVDLKGKISATSGEIGGFVIGENAIYNSKASLDSDTNGVYLGTDGISIGKTGSKPAIKLSKNGEVEINSMGSVQLSKSGNIMDLDGDGISFGNSTTKNTNVTKDKISIYRTYIDKNTVHCSKYDGDSNYYTDISGNEIKLHGGLSSGWLAISSGQTTWASSDSYCLKDNNTNNLAVLKTGVVNICAGNVHIGGSATRLYFFGESIGSTKKSVTKITSPASATTASVATTLNSLLEALKAYNLIG